MMERQIAEIAMVGTVEAVDFDKTRVRVKLGDTNTRWIPWAQRAGRVRQWNPPGIGEQVLVISPNGNRDLALCICGINYHDKASPFDSGDRHGHRYDDGGEVTYDQAAHELAAKLPEDGVAKITIGITTAKATKEAITLTVEEAVVEVRADTIKATLGESSAELTEEGITLAIGAVKIALTASGVTISGQVDFTP